MCGKFMELEKILSSPPLSIYVVELGKKFRGLPLYITGNGT